MREPCVRFVLSSDEESEEEYHERIIIIPEHHDLLGSSTGYLAEPLSHQQQSTLNTIPVTCNSIKGTLNVTKFSQGEPCIHYRNRIHKPSEFECIAGKGSYRNWKKTIYYKNEPLKYWLEEGTLYTEGFRKKAAETPEVPLEQCISFSSEDGSEADNGVHEECGSEVTDSEYEEENENPGAQTIATQKKAAIDKHKDGSEADNGVHEECGSEVTDSEHGEENENPGAQTIATKKKAAIVKPGLSSQPGDSQSSSIESICIEVTGNVIGLLNDEDRSEAWVESTEVDDGMNTMAPVVPPVQGGFVPREASTHADFATHDPRDPQVLEERNTSDMMEGQSLDSYLDTLDKNKLKREKLKMHFKVLKLQEEYYTLKIKKLKKE